MAAEAWGTDYRQMMDLEIKPDNRWLIKLLEYLEFLVLSFRPEFWGVSIGGSQVNETK